MTDSTDIKSWNEPREARFEACLLDSIQKISKRVEIPWLGMYLHGEP
jgi:hypothetical protein